jgi:hypothetical protein
MIFFPRRRASFIGCNVVKWEDQVALFDLAIAQFGAVDIVVGQKKICCPAIIKRADPQRRDQ